MFLPSADPELDVFLICALPLDLTASASSKSIEILQESKPSGFFVLNWMSSCASAPE
jgi:hypothetical protein